MGTRVQALLAFVDDTLLGKVRPGVIHKLANSLRLGNACGIPNEFLRHLPRRPLVHIFLITAFDCPVFQSVVRK
jgi:hypothetical protein